jgi:hypothetical protein
MIGLKICELMKQGSNLNSYRDQMRKSKLLINWNDTAKAWLEVEKKELDVKQKELDVKQKDTNIKKLDLD